MTKFAISESHSYIYISEGGWKQFPVLSKSYILMGHYTHSISVDAKIMVSIEKTAQLLVNMLLSILWLSCLP